MLSGSAESGRGFVLDLPAYKNDVLHALAESGGLPGLNAKNEVKVLRGTAENRESRDALIRSFYESQAGQRCLAPPPLPVVEGAMPSSFAPLARKANPAVATVKARVKEAFKKDAVLHQYSDPNMIGGVKLRIGDQLIDGSVATQLRSMRESVSTRGSTKIRSRVNDFLA